MSANEPAGTLAARVDDPTDLSSVDYKAALKRTLAEIKDDDVPGLAAGVAFKMFLALFPSLLAAVAVFSIVTTVAEMQSMLEQARTFMPNSAVELLQSPLEELASGGGGAAGFAALGGIAAGLFAATSAAVSLMKALSRAYDTPEARKFVKQRLIGLALTLALLVALVGVVLLLVAGPQVQRALVPGLVAPFTWLLAIGRFVLALLVLVVLFAFVYWVGPDREQPRWVWMSPGAVVAVVGWLAASGGFALYAQTVGNYNETYGALGGVIVMLIWLQLSMLVILVGGELNAEIERRRAVRQRVGEGAGFAVPAPAGAAAAMGGDAGEAAVVQAAVEAHTVAPDPGHGFTAEPVAAQQPPPDGHDDAAAVTSARKTGALIAGLIALAVFLGFARKRGQR